MSGGPSHSPFPPFSVGCAKFEAMRYFLFCALLAAFACSKPQSQQVTLSSPDTQLQAQIFLTADGTPMYRLLRGETVLIDSSALGLDFGAATNGWEWQGVQTDSIRETWEMPWGEQRVVENHANSLALRLHSATALQPNSKQDLQMTLHFRLSNDGLAFRYELPAQGKDSVLYLREEHSAFNLPSDATAWWLPGDWDINEHLYTRSAVSQINALGKRNHPNLAQTHIPHNAVLTPFTLRRADSIHLAFHEASLVDYPEMTLGVDTVNLRLHSILVGSDNTPYKAEMRLPFKTPWRVVMVSENAAGLLASRLIDNLNEPAKLADVSWFKPTKYVGMWWQMHLGINSWDMASGKHGATTARVKALIDFAAENGIGAILVEGWNTGWEHWIGFEDREGVFDFVTPYADYDLEGIVSYGRAKGVELIMHHETSSAVTTYDQQLDTAYRLMDRLGIRAVKTGYVGKIIPKGEYHHGQYMVRHHHRVIEKAAQYRVAVNAHEPIKGAGIRRTWPNVISREGLRGQEFNAWSSDGGNPPNHLPTVAFTRLLDGPIDYTPGIFNLSLKPHKPNNQVNTTLAHQLALYVVIYSPIQMVPDLPEHYRGHPAFQFIKDVAVDWEQSRVLAGEVGEYAVLARQERGGDRWFLGAITGYDARQLDLPLDFLTSGKKYRVVVYEDAPDAHWQNKPAAYNIRSLTLQKGDRLQLSLAPGGGAAVSLEVVD